LTQAASVAGAPPARRSLSSHLSLVIPVFNEEANLTQLLEKLRQILEEPFPVCLCSWPPTWGLWLRGWASSTFFMPWRRASSMATLQAGLPWPPSCSFWGGTQLIIRNTRRVCGEDLRGSEAAPSPILDEVIGFPEQTY
jgi:hypothetical protein